MHALSIGARSERTTLPTDESLFLPRFIRLRDAPTYLGMDRNRFNREVRQLLAVIPIGTQGNHLASAQDGLAAEALTL